MSNYTPYRILQTFVAVVRDRDDVLACYPHGKRGERMIATGTVGIVFSEGVIDAPTEEEIALFSLPTMSKLAKQIPQDPRGFDSRLSGVARSLKGSKRGREKATIEKHERKHAKVKPESEKKPEPKAEAEPEIIASTEPLIKDLEYLGPAAIKSLAEKNVLHIADLAGWTADALNELRGVGTKLAGRLLVEYEAHPKVAEPVTDETKEGDLNE